MPVEGHDGDPAPSEAAHDAEAIQIAAAALPAKSVLPIAPSSQQQSIGERENAVQHETVIELVLSD